MTFGYQIFLLTRKNKNPHKCLPDILQEAWLITCDCERIRADILGLVTVPRWWWQFSWAVLVHKANWQPSSSGITCAAAPEEGALLCPRLCGDQLTPPLPRVNNTQDGEWARRMYWVSKKHSGMQKPPERSDIWLEKQAFFPMGFRMRPRINNKRSKPFKAITATAMTSAHPAFTDHPRPYK